MLLFCQNSLLYFPLVQLEKKILYICLFKESFFTCKRYEASKTIMSFGLGTIGRDAGVHCFKIEVLLPIGVKVREKKMGFCSIVYQNFVSALYSRFYLPL